MVRPTRRAVFTRRLVPFLAASAAAAALLVSWEHAGHASTPLTLKTIAIDGAFGDWDAVLANAGQTTHDGDGSSSYLTLDNCTTLSSDRDCPQRLFGGAGNDFVTFAWTYDASAVYLYIERYGSTTNGVDFLFVADVDRNVRLDGADRVVHVNWQPQNGNKPENVTLKRAPYVPSAGHASDPIRCEAGAGSFCTNRAGLANVPDGSVDGFTLAGSMGTETECAGCAARGALDGKRLEIAVPWSVFEVDPLQPFNWHVVSSNTPALSGAIDNIGAPGGGLGSFLQRGVSLVPDRTGAVLSPGTVSYVHALRNEGNDTDAFELAATSSQGATIELLDGTTVLATDLGGDGTWDSVAGGGAAPMVTLGAGIARDLTVRISMPVGRSGEDVTRLTARSMADATVTAGVTNTTHVGTPAFVPETFEGWVVVGQPIDVRETLWNGDTGAHVFELTVDDGCPGWRADLALDGGTGPGTIVATDADGDGTWDEVSPSADADGDGLPDLGSLDGLASRAFYLRLTPPPGAAVGASCTLALTAAEGGAAAAARHAVHVAAAVSFEPDRRGTTAGSADGGDVRIPKGSTVFFPAYVRNAEGTTRVYALSASTAGAGAAAPRIWSDPDGNGNPSDGEPIAQTSPLAPWGGVQHVIVEVGATAGAPAQTLLVTTATATATEGGATDSQVSEAVVGWLGAYADALHTSAQNAFAPCSTVYVEGRGLAPSNGTAYALAWTAPYGAAPAGESPWPTTTNGTAEARLALAADAALGPWSAVLTDTVAPLENDTLPFQVELDGAVTLSTDRERFPGDRGRYAPGETVTVAAEVRNRGGAALERTSLEYAGATDRVRTEVTVAAGASVPDAFSFVLAQGEAPGTRTLSLGWILACGAAPFASGVAQLDVVPPPPAVTAPASGAAVATATPTLRGTAADGATVVVTVDGGAQASPPLTAAGGAWSWTPAALADGPHDVTATQRIAGVESDPSSAVHFAVDTVPPSLAPVIHHPVDGSATNLLAVAVDGEASDPQAARAEVVEVVGGNAVALGTFDVVAGAPPRFAGTVTLAAGTHELRARALDAAGNSSVDSAPVRVTVDVDPPLAAAELWPADGALLGSAEAGSGVNATGTAEAGATVHLVLEHADTHEVLLVLDATRNGTAFQAPLGALADGRYVLTVTVVDVAGNPSAAAVASFTVDATVASPAFTEPLAGTTLDGTQAPAGRVVVSGTAEAGATVSVTIGAETRGVAAGPGGAWSTAFDLGDTGLRTAFVAGATQTDLARNTSAPASIAFDVDTRSLPPTVSSPAPGATLGLADAPARSVPVSGTTEAGAAVHLAFEHVATGAVAEADAAVAGTSFSRSVTLPSDGVWRLTATARDAAGNPAVAAAPIELTLDTVSEAPAVVSPAPDATLNLADTPDGLVVTGTAEVGATVTVAIGAAIETAAATSGSWSVTFAALADGSHVLAASAVDAAGNPRSAETQVPFSLDRNAPPAPVVDAPAPGASFAPGPVEVRGHAEAGARVTIAVVGAGSPIDVIAGADGAFAATISVPEGTQTIAVVATDAAGNASAATQVSVTARTTSGSGGGGCGCGQGSPAPSALAALALAALAPRRRRA